MQSEARRAAAIRTPLALTLGLLAFLLANAFLLNGLIWSVSPEPHRVTVLKHSWDVLRGEGGDDSWGAMVSKGRLGLQKFVELTATAPAKIYNLHPRKGSIAIGADADIAVWDPKRQVTFADSMIARPEHRRIHEGAKVADGGAPQHTITSLTELPGVLEL